MNVSSRTLTVIIVIVACVWAASMAAEIFIPTADVPSGINEVMMAMVGFLFAGRQAKVEAEKKDDNEEEDA